MVGESLMVGSKEFHSAALFFFSLGSGRRCIPLRGRREWESQRWLRVAKVRVIFFVGEGGEVVLRLLGSAEFQGQAGVVTTLQSWLLFLQ